MIINPFTLSNLFSADYRTKELARYGNSDAEFVTVGELEAEELQDYHDCKLSIKGYCAGCADIAAHLSQ